MVHILASLYWTSPEGCLGKIDSGSESQNGASEQSSRSCIHLLQRQPLHEVTARCGTTVCVIQTRRCCVCSDRRRLGARESQAQSSGPSRGWSCSVVSTGIKSERAANAAGSFVVANETDREGEKEGEGRKEEDESCRFARSSTRVTPYRIAGMCRGIRSSASRGRVSLTACAVPSAPWPTRPRLGWSGRR